jgi:hypothetical protein
VTATFRVIYVVRLRKRLDDQVAFDEDRSGEISSLFFHSDVEAVHPDGGWKATYAVYSSRMVRQQHLVFSFRCRIHQVSWKAPALRDSDRQRSVLHARVMDNNLKGIPLSQAERVGPRTIGSDLGSPWAPADLAVRIPQRDTRNLGSHGRPLCGKSACEWFVGGAQEAASLQRVARRNEQGRRA